MRYKSLNDDAKKEWHDWFAWFPVRISDYEKVWLCKVRRIGYIWYDYHHFPHKKWDWRYELA